VEVIDKLGGYSFGADWNGSCLGGTTRDENGRDGSGNMLAASRAKKRSLPFWRFMPVCEPDPDAERSTYAWHNGVSPSPRGEEHEKESHRFFQAAASARARRHRC
jgi:hypothetical protein